jgi:hypothetical protein
VLTFKVTGVEEAKELFDPRTVLRAATSALNKVATAAKTTTIEQITKNWNIKRSDLTTTGTGKNRLKVKPASMNSLTATLTIEGRPVSLSYFGAVQRIGNRVITRKSGRTLLRAAGYKPQGVTVEVLKGRKAHLRRAFLAGTRSGHVGVFIRKGKDHHPIINKYVITIGSMVRKPAVMDAIVGRIEEQWPKTFAHELEYYQGKK